MRFDSILTVTVPATVKALTTIDNVRDELVPFGLTDTSMDGMLDRWIKRASGVIHEYIGRPISLATYQEVFTPQPGWWLDRAEGVEGTRKLMLSVFPIVSLISATNFDGAIADGTFSLDMPTGIIRPITFQPGGLWSGPAGTSYGGPPLTFTYQGGYDLASAIPSALESVCLELIITKWTRRGRDSSVQLTVMGDNVGRTAFFDHGNDVFALNSDMISKLNSFKEQRS